MSERPLHDFIDMEVYDVVAGSTHRRLVEQFEAVVEATRFKAGEDCWCSFRQVDDPEWHSPQCERVREILEEES